MSAGPGAVDSRTGAPLTGTCSRPGAPRSTQPSIPPAATCGSSGTSAVARYTAQGTWAPSMAATTSSTASGAVQPSITASTRSRRSNRCSAVRRSGSAASSGRPITRVSARQVPDVMAVT